MRNEADENARTKYLLNLFGSESELHKKITEKSKEENVLGMQISAYEGQMLELLATLANAKTVVEIGCLYGYSALWLLNALPEDGKLYLLELDPARVEWMKSTFEKHPKFAQIEWRVGDAVQNLEALSACGPFDLCFIDANKAAYATYLTWVEKNLKKGGLILGDNSFLWGGVYNEEYSEKNSNNQLRSMKEFNTRLADRGRYLATLIPTDEGLTVAQKLF